MYVLLVLECAHMRTVYQENKVAPAPHGIIQRHAVPGTCNGNTTKLGL